MNFFNKFKKKLAVSTLLNILLFVVLAALFAFVAFQIGFAVDEYIEFGLRGSKSGIPIPKVIVSSVFLIVCCLMLVSAGQGVWSIIKSIDYNKLMTKVIEIGNVEEIGEMLDSMEKSKYIKSADLRFNNEIVFYMKDTTASIIKTEDIIGIRSEIVGKHGSETNFVAVYSKTDVIKIPVSQKNVLPLLEEMRNTCTVQTRDN